jgi:hypothetical protein
MTCKRVLESSVLTATGSQLFWLELRMSPSLHDPPPEGSESFKSNVVHRRVEITVEREIVSVVYQPAANITGRCEQCGRDVLLLSADAAAAAQNISTREIYRWLDENKLHFQESQGGTVFICSESLKRAPEKELP